MAHFAKIVDGVVEQVIVVDDLYEDDGANYLKNVVGLDGTWIKTSYNTSGGEHSTGGKALRKNYAGIGFTYDAEKDAFIPPKPEHDSWLLNEKTCLWEAPVAMPQDGKMYNWLEETQEWVEIPLPE